MFGAQGSENTPSLKSRNNPITEKFRNDDFEDDLRSWSKSGLVL
jgi:hypothetical protein